jgi:hypothetical protein
MHEQEGNAVTRTAETANVLLPDEYIFIRAPYVSGNIVLLLAVDTRAEEFKTQRE